MAHFLRFLMPNAVFPQQRPDLQMAAEVGQPPNHRAQLPGGGARLSEHPHGVRRQRRGLHPPREGQFSLQTFLWPVDR